MHGKKLPYYGKLRVKQLDPEVYKIWLTRNNELNDLSVPDDDPINFYNMEFEAQDYMRKIWDSSDLNDVQRRIFLARVMFGETLEKLAGQLGVTRETIRQIEVRAIRKLRRAAQALDKSPQSAQLNHKRNRKTLADELLFLRIAR